MMDAPAQYIYSQDYHPMMYPPAFDVRGPFGAKDMDMLTARMENAYITPPAHSDDIWNMFGSASVSRDLRSIHPSSGPWAHFADPKSYQVSGQQGGGGLLSEYDVPAPWQEGYASVPQVADGGDEDIRYVEQHVVSAKNPVRCP